MDRQIQRKKWPLKRILLVGGSPLILLAMVYFAVQSRASTFKTDRNKLTFGTIVYDQFQEIAAFQAAVEPERTIQLDASEGGIVEEILAEDGMMVDSGQALLRLSNTTLRLDFMNRETQIVEQINNLRSTRITLDQNKRQVQEQLVDLKYDLMEQERQFAIDSSLYVDSTISKNQYDASRARLHYLRRKQVLLNERLETDEAYRQSQLARIDNSVDMMERNLEAIRKNLENLIVRAPMSGQLNSFDHEVGQTKARGENLGRVDNLNSYLLSALVDQYYLNRIKVGQQASISSAGQRFHLQVRKIYPTVVNSQFEVQLEFVDTLIPNNIRRGQNFQVKLELSAAKEAVLAPRGAYSQSNSGKYVYVVSAEGDEAVKRDVTLGSQNPLYIEILQGLEQGEQIITSSYQSFGEADKIVLNP